MTTRDHLIYHLQEQYAFQRDFLPLLNEMEHGGSDEHLRLLLHEEHEGLRNEMETLDRGLSLLGARFKQESNAVVPALRETTERFKHRMNPTPEHRDIHAALEVMKVSLMSVAEYQGDAEMARAIGEQDVALLLEENLHRQTQGLERLQAFIPQLIAKVSKSEARRAA